MWPQRGAAFELRPLGSHVAVRDSPSPVRLTHCLTGVDYGHEDHQVRGQNLQLHRRRWISSSCGRFAANGVASLRGLLPRRRWAFLLQWCFEVGYIDSRLCWTCDFASLTDRYSSEAVEVVRRPYMCGKHCNLTLNARPDRHQVCST